MSATKQIIFDFDGTIADTFSILLPIVNKVLEKHKRKPLTEEEVNLLKGMTMHEACKHAGISKLRFFVMIWQVKAILKGYMDEVPPVQGMLELVKSLKKQGYQLGIVTSNSVENVQFFLKKHNLPYFDYICSCHHFVSKSRTIKKLFRTRKMMPEKVIYIGDEVRDVEAAQRSAIQIIAVSWGLNTVESLTKASPNYLVNSPMELEKIIQEIF